MKNRDDRRQKKNQKKAEDFQKNRRNIEVQIKTDFSMNKDKNIVLVDIESWQNKQEVITRNTIVKGKHIY